ncbi:MAG: isoprenylcysteine carboxylmethyltransferase family protein [Cyclobacteriaceae bacterium]|nr:isoprenylcysteine carboxylmethyltransferase family protein [Cyclobacteriaceae bacterium]MCH8514750.1 isoprenylcysteine carboxylmethyltransferase family protein [Cyclobacteriaceae bacterium]
MNRTSLVYVILQLILMVFFFFIPDIFPDWRFDRFLIIGILWIFFGIAISIWAMITLGKNLSPFPHPKKDAKFIRKGLFNYVRHPIYSGILLTYLGLCLFNGYIACYFYLFFILTPFFISKYKYEEKQLKATFPEYEKYQENIGAIFPNLKEPEDY